MITTGGWRVKYLVLGSMLLFLAILTIGALSSRIRDTRHRRRT